MLYLVAICHPLHTTSIVFRARQILYYLCMETGNPSLAETLPFEMHGILGLYQELALFVKMTSVF